MEATSHGTSIQIYRKYFIYGFYLVCDRASIYRWAGGLLSPPYTTLARVWHT